MTTCSIIVTDTGPLKTLAYAESLHLLLSTSLSIHIADMVIEELKAKDIEGNRIALQFINEQRLRGSGKLVVVDTGVPANATMLRTLRVDPGDQALKILLDEYAESQGEKYALVLFEDYDIAKKTFVLPDNVYLMTTRAFLSELEKRNVIGSAEELLKKAELAAADCGDARSLLNRKKEYDVPPKRNRSVKPF